MMMITFITLKSIWVPLMKVFSSNPCGFYLIKVVNGFQKVFRESLDIESGVDLVHNNLYPQPKRVRLSLLISHFWRLFWDTSATNILRVFFSNSTVNAQIFDFPLPLWDPQLTPLTTKSKALTASCLGRSQGLFFFLSWVANTQLNR